MKIAILKRNTPLKAKTGLKRSGNPMKRSSFAVRRELSLREELDNIVSKVVRLGSADVNGMVKCVTCGVIKFWKFMQCGHFQKRQHTATRYDMRNLGVQCEECNCFHDGKEKEFAEAIDGFYGPGTAEELRIKAQTIVPDYPYDQEIIKWGAVLQTLVENSNGIEY